MRLKRLQRSWSTRSRRTRSTTLLLHGQVCDFEFPAPAEVRLDYYRAGQELFFQGHIAGGVVGHCARCLEEYTFDLDKDFFVVLVPKSDLPAEVELER